MEHIVYENNIVLDAVTHLLDLGIDNALLPDAINAEVENLSGISIE